MNPLETKVFTEMTGDFKRAWLAELAKTKGPAPIAAIGALLDFSETVEQAITELRTRAKTHPALVAQQVAFKAKPGTQIWQLGIPLLRELPEKEREIGLKRVSRTSNSAKPSKWSGHIKKVRQAIRG